MAKLAYNIDDVLGNPMARVMEEPIPSFDDTFYSAVGPASLDSGQLLSNIEQKSGTLWNGKTTFANTVAGYRLGVDSSDGLLKFYIGDATNYLNWTGTALTIAGSLSATSGTIGGWSINSTSIYTGTEDFSGYTANAGDITIYSNGTDASIHAKNWFIDTAGVLNCTAAVISGAITTTASSVLDGQYLSALSVGNAAINDLAVTKLTAGTISSKSIVLAIAAGTGDVEIRSGIAAGDFANTGAASGFIIGLDDSDSDKAKFYFGSSTNYVKYDGTTTTFKGAVTIDSGSGIANLSDAGALATEDSVTSSLANLALRGWIQTSAFTVTDLNTIAWGTGTFTASDGTSYSISAGNTGNMSAKTYVYLDIAVSTTAYQVTTTATTAIGNGKVLIAICQNGATEAVFMLLNNNSYNIDAANIVAGSITANEIAATTITSDKLSVSQLSAIAADLGTITAGTVTGATLRTSVSNPKFNITSTAFQGIETGGNVVFEVVIDGANAGDVIMGDDATGSYAMWDDSAGTFQVFADNIPVSIIGTFGGDGSDGALTITSGTTTVSAAGAQVFLRNYTSVSITSTATLTFSNPHASGTIFIVKSQGAVVLTATTPIDVSALGGTSGTGGAGGLGGSNGATGTDGTNGSGIFDELTTHDGVGGAGGGGAGGTGGVVLSTISVYLRNAVALSRRMTIFACGSGGGGGGGGESTSSINAWDGGAGGRGGGAMLIECRGDLNFTGTINASVTNGSDGEDSIGGSGESNAGGGGGGGGAGGMVAILYATATATSGTINTAGGAGGAGGDGDSNGGGSATEVQGGSGGGGGGGTGGNGAAGGTGSANEADAGDAGGAGSNERSGGGGGGGSSRRGNSAGTTSGGAAGSAGSSENVYVAQNNVFA